MQCSLQPASYFGGSPQELIFLRPLLLLSSSMLSSEDACWSTEGKVYSPLALESSDSLNMSSFSTMHAEQNVLILSVLCAMKSACKFFHVCLYKGCSPLTQVLPKCNYELLKVSERCHNKQRKKQHLQSHAHFGRFPTSDWN